MNLAILGATGATGLEIVRQAVGRGHTVTALARRPNPELEALAGVRVVLGDARDANVITELLVGQDAVISSLGLSAAGSNEEQVFVCTDAVTHILAEFERTGPRRLVAISTHGVNDSHDDSDYVAQLWDRMGERLLDKERMEQLLFAAPALDWTVVRCPRIEDGGSPALRAATDLRVDVGQSVHRGALAGFVIDLAESGDHRGEALSVVS